MGLFSKLLGNTEEAAKADKAAKDLLGGLFGNDKDSEKKVEQTAKSIFGDILNAQQQANRAPTPQQPVSTGSNSYYKGEYDSIPTEPCQYNFSGSYEAYFEDIFASEFPQYRTGKYTDGTSTVYTFFNSNERALIVELKSERSSANKIKRACQADGLPYLRFYYDHDGWWNKRSYVVERISSAL